MLFSKKFLCILFLTFLVVGQGFSQKRVKYKDLFPILQSKDYKTAAPLLFQYLADNPDEANPNFYLGEILAAKLDSTEIFPNSKPYDSLASLAIASYKKAIRLVDDREIRKNDEFYIAYNRRDLRTGKFGIKLSDVHLDYENKISSLKEKMELIDQIFEQKSVADSLISELYSKLESLQKEFPNEKSFLFRSDTEDFDRLRNINKMYVQLKSEIDEYFTLLNRLKSANKAPTLQVQALENWSSIEGEPIDLFAGEIKLKDYQSYFSLILLTIEDEIMPLKTLLSETDLALSKMLEKNRTVTDSSQIIKVKIPAKLREELFELDAGAFPIKILEYKILKNEAQIMQNDSIFPVLNDSSNVFQRVNLFHDISDHLNEMDEMLDLIGKFATEENKLNYQFYLENFSPSFEGYLETEVTLNENQIVKINEESNQLDKLSKLFIHQNDSIFIDSLSALEFESQFFVRQLIEKDKYLLIAGQNEESPFIAKAQFNMNIETLHVLEDSAQFLNIIQVNDKILLNAAFTDKLNQLKISSYNQKLEHLWSFEFESSFNVESAKEEAGILFLYNEEGDVIKTLNSKGNEIGN